MKFVQICMFVVLLERMVLINAVNEDTEFGWNDAISNQTVAAYNVGVLMGIINPTKYTLKSFEQDQPIFKDAYEEFVFLLGSGSEQITYQEWLLMNNYGIIYGTNDSLLEKKPNPRRKRQHSSTKERFMRAVRTGDILISTKNSRGLVGHAALMVSDYWVLEMRGKKRRGSSHNRQIPKNDWFNEYGYEWTTVFRCPDSAVASQAAYWADRAYFNPNGGQDQTICVSYKVTPDFETTNPSYSSKLVLQAYYYGASGVIGDVTKYGPVIAPTRIPSYFMPPYELIKIGKF